MAVYTLSENNTLKASASLAASGVTTNDLDLSTSGPLEATVYVGNTGGGTVQAAAQVTVSVLVSVDGGTTYTTLSGGGTFGISTVASTLVSNSITLAGGKRYRFQFTNTDTANATTVVAIYSKVTAFS